MPDALNPAKTRYQSLDIIKGFAILAVVIGHSGSKLTDFVYLFHMAVFFMASGFTYRPGSVDSIQSFFTLLKRRLKRLYIPYVATNVIFSLLHNFFIKVNIYTNNPAFLPETANEYFHLTELWTNKEMLRNILHAFLWQGSTELGGALWFLKDLFFICLGYALLDWILIRVFRIQKTALFQTVVSVILLAIGYVFQLRGFRFYGFERIFSCYILYHLGQFCRYAAGREQAKPWYIRLGMLAASLAVLLVCIHRGQMHLGQNLYPNPIYLLLVSLAGWFFLSQLAFFVAKVPVLTKIFQTLGRDSLPIVILHFLSFKIVSFTGILILGLPAYMAAAFPVLFVGELWAICYTVVGAAVPLLVNTVWKTTKTHLISAFRVRNTEC